MKKKKAQALPDVKTMQLKYLYHSIKHGSKEYIVTSISSRAFYHSNIKSFAFKPNSELQTIEKHAFQFSNFVSILIPAHVTQICENAFNGCKQLTRVDFEPNSELQTVGTYAFSSSNIASILIPAHITQICEYAFQYCMHFQIDEIDENSIEESIESCAFSKCKIIMLPIK